MDAAVNFPTTPKSVKAAPLKLSPRTTVERAFQAIALNCLEQVQANEAGVALYHDVESLHQMRVGLRRLRSALGMFKDVLRLPPDVQEGLAWLVAQLGAARDWDVLGDSTLPLVDSACAGDTQLAGLRQAVRDKSLEAHAAASAAIGSLRYQHFLQSFTRWIDQRAWRDSAPLRVKYQLDARIPTFADAILARHRKRMRQRGARLQQATPDARHQLRIAAKKNRYAAEFFASLYRRKRVRPFVAALSELQDELGSLNDAAIAERLLAQLQGERPELAQSAGFVRGFLASRVQVAEATLGKRWKKFERVKALRLN